MTLRVGLYAITFCVLKSIVFIAPLAASNVYSLATYGVLEWTIALATTLVPVVALGLTAAVPYFLLHVGRPEVAESVRLHGGIVAATGIAVTTLLLLARQIEGALLAGAISAFTVQAMWSSFAKAQGRATRASLYDAGVYATLLASLLISVWHGIGELAFVVALLCYLIVLLSQARMDKGTLVHASEAIRYGISFVVPTFAMVALVNSGRSLGGYLLTDEQIGLYAFLFRIAAPVVLIHQLLGVLLFKELYATRDPLVLDHYFAKIVLVVATAGFVVLLLIRHADMDVSAALTVGKATAGFGSAHYWMTLQMVLWVGLALVEPIMARENRAKAQTVTLGVALGAFAVSVFLLDAVGQLSLSALVATQVLAFGGALLLILRQLRDVNIGLPRFTAAIWITMAAMPIGLGF